LASTGAQAFNPSAGSVCFYALRRCGIKRTAVEVDHLVTFEHAANLVLSDLSTEQPNLWKVTLLSTPLIQGTVQYTMPANILLVLNCYIRYGVGGINNDRIIYGVSRDEYSSYPNKLLQQPPTVYWVDRTAPIVLNIYPAPDGNGPYTLFVYGIQQDDDVALAGAATFDLPYRYFKAFSDGVCYEMALTYAPERSEELGVVYHGVDGKGGSKGRAQAQDRENVPLSIVPSFSRYWQ